jgi:Rieske Fe-S protein
MPFFRRPSSEALWKDEFSIFTSDERYVSRRQFAKFLTLASLGMFAGNLWILLRSYLSKTAAYPSAAVAQLGEIPIDGVKIFSYPSPQDRCILIRTGENEYKAYSQKCTHLSCAVYYEKETRRLACPCHQGFFSVDDGSVLQGPPPRPLPRIVLQHQNQDLMAVGVRLG